LNGDGWSVRLFEPLWLGAVGVGVWTGSRVDGLCGENDDVWLSLAVGEDAQRRGERREFR
jgi:hypothetical protein